MKTYDIKENGEIEIIRYEVISIDRKFSKFFWNIDDVIEWTKTINFSEIKQVKIKIPYKEIAKYV